MLARIAALGHGVQDASRGWTLQRSCRANLWEQRRAEERVRCQLFVVRCPSGQGGEGKGKGEGAKGQGVGGSIERRIRTRGDMLGYLVAHHDCPDGEAVCQWFCHRDNVWVGVDRVGGVGPHCSRPEETALPDKAQ